MKHKIFQKFDLLFFVAILIMILFLALSARAQRIEKPEIVASGGTFALEKAVVAGGGNSMSQQSLNLNATTGQAVAGQRSTGGNFALFAGFWTPNGFAPTSAEVIVGGRIKTAAGKGIKNVIVTVAFPSGEQRTVVSGALGYYRFANVPSGATYVFSVSAKRYSFSQPTQARNITDETEDIDFVADAPNQTVSEAAPN